MVPHTATDASGAKDASDIDVETKLKPQPAKPPDADEPIRSRGEHQGIRSRLGFDRCQLEARPILSLDGARRSKVHNCPQPKP